MARTTGMKRQSFSADTTSSQPARKRFFHVAHSPFGGPLKWFNSANVIVMQDRIELIWQTRVKIMVNQFCLRPINHTDGSLETLIAQLPRNITWRREECLRPRLKRYSRNLFVFRCSGNAWAAIFRSFFVSALPLDDLRGCCWLANARIFA